MMTTLEALRAKLDGKDVEYQMQRGNDRDWNNAALCLIARQYAYEFYCPSLCDKLEWRLKPEIFKYERSVSLINGYFIVSHGERRPNTRFSFQDGELINVEMISEANKSKREIKFWCPDCKRELSSEPEFMQHRCRTNP